MNLYTGEYWISDSRSEYGGVWVVVAKDKQECVQLLNQYQYQDEDDKDHSDLVESVENAQCFQLKDENIESQVVREFFT